MIEDLEPHIPSTDNLEEDIDEQESQLLQLEGLFLISVFEHVGL